MRKKYFSSITALIALIAPLIFPFFTHIAYATVTTDHQNGLYADDFSNNTGVPTRSYVNVNTAQGVLQLTNTTSQTSFTPPYRTSGNARTTALRPLLVAQWGTLSVDATIPQGTTLKVQVMDRNSKLWPDYILAGNSGGIDISETSEIDLSVMPYLEYCSNIWDTTCADPRSIRINILMTTEDTNITPTIDNLSFDWSPRQGTFQETVSISEDDPWPVTGGNQQTTNSTPYFNSETYPAFRWMSERISGDPYIANLFSRKDAIVGHMFNSEGRLFSLNRDTGEENWQIPAVYLGGGFIDSEGVYYSDNMNVDYSQAIDTNTGEVKWVYFSGTHGAHGGQNVALGNNGKLYYTRDSPSSVNTTLVEQSPNGTIESTTVFNVVPEGFASGENKSVSPMRIGPDGRGYVVVSVTKSGSYVDNKGGLWAINLEEKTIEQIYSGKIDSQITIGNDGTVYARVGSWGAEQKKIIALNPNGTVKWDWDGGFDNNLGSTQNLILRQDGNILAKRVVSNDGVLDIFNGVTGDILSRSYYDWSNAKEPQFADGKNGYYSSSTFAFSETEFREVELNYADLDNNMKWEISYPYQALLENKMFINSFDRLIPDERGWVYVGFNKSVYNSQDWSRLIDESFAKVFALAPWTLTDLSDITGAKQVGDTIDFRVKTSMQETNPVFDGENAMQVIMENGDKILLSYSSTDENGDTLWTGFYTLPADFDPSGTGNYTIEASQSYLQTDIETHFDSAPTESNNTGIRLAGSFAFHTQEESIQAIPQESAPDIIPPTNKGERILLDKTSIDFKKTTYLQETKPQLKGVNTDAKNGFVSIYTKTKKGGSKKIATISVDEKGVWKYTLKKETGEDPYALQFSDASGNISNLSKFFTIVRDDTNPELTISPDTQMLHIRTEPITFEAKDTLTDIDYYQVQLYNKQGRVIRPWRTQQSSENFYYLPEALLNDTYTIAVRVYDKAGNSTRKEVTLEFVDSLSREQTTTQNTKQQTAPSLSQQNELNTDDTNITNETSFPPSSPEAPREKEEYHNSKEPSSQISVIQDDPRRYWWKPWTWFRKE